MKRGSALWHVIAGLLVGGIAALAVTGTLAAPAPEQEASAGAKPEPPWVDEAFGCRLVAKTAGDSYSVAEPIIVQVVLTNTSAETQTIRTESTQWWLVRATDQLGLDVPRTRHGRSLRGEVPGYPRTQSVGGGPLSPGLSKRQTIVLNQLCDLTMQGTYSVTIGKIIAQGSDFVVLQAPPLTIRIGVGGPSLSADVQRLALTDDPDARQDLLRSVGGSVERGLQVLAESAEHDKDESVREAARKVIGDVSAKLSASLAGSQGASGAK